MRQIKNFMEAKRPMWNCNECKCITMQCWKESEAFCGCGEWWDGLLSWEEIVAMNGEEPTLENTQAVLAELNRDPVWYRNKFLSEWHILLVSDLVPDFPWIAGYLSSDGTVGGIIDGKYINPDNEEEWFWQYWIAIEITEEMEEVFPYELKTWFCEYMW